MSETVKRKKKSQAQTAVLYTRVPKTLELVLKRDAEVYGRSIADHTRLIFEMAAHLGMLARVREPEVQRAIKRKGTKPADYEAGLKAEIRAVFNELYGAPLPKDAYDMLSGAVDE